VRSEQGIGDTIQFVRYLPILQAMGAHVVFECPSALSGLLSACGGYDELVTRSSGDPVHVRPDAQEVYLMSLPGALGTNLSSIPAGVPYVHPDSEYLRKWERLIGPDGGGSLRVALCWAGNPDHLDDAFRSCSLRDFAPITSVPGCSFYSLQKGEAAHQCDTNGSVRQLGHFLEDFRDTAAAIAHMDLVVTVDTAVAHLSGAMGKPVWTMLAFHPDWRWMLNTPATPWYPTMRLFRQPVVGCWSEPFEVAAEELRGMALGTCTLEDAS